MFTFHIGGENAGKVLYSLLFEEAWALVALLVGVAMLSSAWDVYGTGWEGCVREDEGDIGG